MNSHDFSALWRLAKSLEQHAPDTPLTRCAQMHRHATQAGHVLHARDHYGRPLGMAYWHVAPRQTASISWLASVPGQGRLMLAHLLSQLAAVGIQRFEAPMRQPKDFDVLRVLRKLPKRLGPIEPAELHPVLAGQAAGPEAEAAIAGAALHVLAQVPRLAQVPIQGCVQLIDRARGAGHLRVIRNAALQPIGLLVWARPSGADLPRLWRRKDEACLHACELNMGGDLALVEYAALHSEAVAGLLHAIRSELDADGGGVNLLLQRAGGGQDGGDLVSIGRDDVPRFLDWFGKQLAAQSLVHKTC